MCWVLELCPAMRALPLFAISPRVDLYSVSPSAPVSLSSLRVRCVRLAVSLSQSAPVSVLVYSSAHPLLERARGGTQGGIDSGAQVETGGRGALPKS